MTKVFLNLNGWLLSMRMIALRRGGCAGIHFDFPINPIAKPFYQLSGMMRRKVATLIRAM